MRITRTLFQAPRLSSISADLARSGHKHERSVPERTRTIFPSLFWKNSWLWPQETRKSLSNFSLLENFSRGDWDPGMMQHSSCHQETGLMDCWRRRETDYDLPTSTGDGSWESLRRYAACLLDTIVSMFEHEGQVGTKLRELGIIKISVRGIKELEKAFLCCL